MRFNYKKKYTRLKKTSEFIDGIMDGDELSSVFINPTDTEIQTARSESGSGMVVRGIITPDSIEYCWRGDVLHHQINSRMSELRLDLSDCLRFASSGNDWVFDCHSKGIYDQLLTILKYSDKLNRYGNLNGGNLSLFYSKPLPKDVFSSYDIEKLSKELGIIIETYCVTFNGSDKLQILIDIIEGENTEYNLE